jgi:hypothetical protein
MYRYIVDNAITYTPEDFVLYRESPFACWMERLTLENPDHGIPPDAGTDVPTSGVQRQDDLAETLRDEGRDVVLVDWQMEESRRRSATLDAIRKGADFIVNGQLALGPLSGAVNLLMRTSGYSDLGDYLYLPCDTQGETTQHSAFRLCFLADLLHMLQGQLPPQMLIIRSGSDVVPLESEQHIYHYRAVKQRFMTAMREFRKHRMPDPAESAHFGRWSDCAHEVMKQRALNSGDEDDVAQDAELEESLFAAAESDANGRYLSQGAAAVSRPDNRVSLVSSVAADARRAGDLQVSPPSSGTLAEQASQLRRGPQSRAPRPVPGYTPNLAPVMSARPESQERRRIGDDLPAGRIPGEGRPPGDVALQNLEFIGSSARPPSFAGEPVGKTATQTDVNPDDAAGAVDRSGAHPAYTFPEQGTSLDPQRPARPDRAERLPMANVDLREVESAIELPATRREKRHPLDSLDIPGAPSSVIDRDEGSPSTPGADPKPVTAAPRFGWERMDEQAEGDLLEEVLEEDGPAVSTVFSDSLITNEEFGERD